MGFISWFRALFMGPKATVRDISTVPGQNKAEAVYETISTRPEPLKPLHHRLTFRDKRLLPKVNPKQRQSDPFWGSRRKEPVMARDEANRLFSRTLRTRNRNIRDLVTDEEQLRRYNLPLWRNEAELAEALGLTMGELRHFSIHRDRETTPHYVAFAVAKRSGGHRIIHAPKKRLKAVQRRLNELLVRHLPVSEQAHGFRPGRSVLSNALPHVNKAVVVKMDLTDCFPTIHFGRVRGLLIALGYGYQVATTLAVLMTEAPRQPVEAEGKLYHVPVGPRVCVQGAPTSPGLCNAILTRLDRRLAGLAAQHGMSYTRYADDLSFSSDDPAKVKLLLTLVPGIVSEEGFTVSSKKTRVQRQARRQCVTGVVVNRQAGLSRKQRRKLRARIHQFAGKDTVERQRLAGKLAYLKMLNPNQAAPLLKAFYGSAGPQEA